MYVDVVEVLEVHDGMSDGHLPETRFIGSIPLNNNLGVYRLALEAAKSSACLILVRMFQCLILLHLISMEAKYSQYPGSNVSFCSIWLPEVAPCTDSTFLRGTNHI